MKIKDVFAKAGPISDYLVYVVLLFGWYLVNDLYAQAQPEAFGSILNGILPWVLRLLVGPALFAVVIGGVLERQEEQDLFAPIHFFSHLKSHLWRLISANFLSLIFYFIITFVVLLMTGIKSPDAEAEKFVYGIPSIIVSTINVFWFVAIVVERKLFRSLLHTLQTLLFNPLALAIGIAWACLSFADTILFDSQGQQVPLVVNIARSGVFAVLRVLMTSYILVIYKDLWMRFYTAAQADEMAGGSGTAQPGEKLDKASLGFTWVSFVPLLHLVALILGLISIKRSQRVTLRAAAACWVGGFFTLFYALLIAGFLIGQPDNARMPGYTFLADGNTELAPYVKFLNRDEIQEVTMRLDDPPLSQANRHWAYDSALALAKYNNNDLDGALPAFYTALKKKPERAEFYFYYGLALLDNKNEDMAVEQFKLALEHDPNLKIAKQYLALVQNEYKPNQVTTAVTSILILIILFGLHEYGHAYAAWKLGDDTAKNQGRLTLNPIAHLDIFGSILLPAMLLMQQSGFVFGWAKPVPVNRENFKNPNRDDRIVSFAGPAVNLMVSMVCMILLGVILILVRLLWPETITLNLAAPSSPVSMVGPQLSKVILILIVFLKDLFYTSLILGFFNLIPIPPLDGSWILASLLPEKGRAIFEMVRRFSFVFFLLVMMTPVVDYFLAIPIGAAWAGLHLLVSALGLV